MAASPGHQFISNWFTILAAAGGVMLTVSLMILTILFTSTLALTHLQRAIPGIFIVISSSLLLLSLSSAIRAHGTLILIVSAPPTASQNDIRSLENIMRERSKRSERSFESAGILLFVAIFLTFILPQLHIG